MVFSVCLVIVVSMASFSASSADTDHSNHHKGHSDALLILLKEKIAIKKLQSAFVLLDTREKKLNLDKQGKSILMAMYIIQPYIAIPESRYPNMVMYHQSLINRGELLEEFAEVMLKHQEQINSIFITK